MYSDVYVGNSHDKRFYGIYRGIVADTNDPANKKRIRLQVPQILGTTTTGWAYSINNTSPSAVGTGVWVMFEGGDPNFPLWLGAF
jgi:hypothetical protein